MRLNFQSFYVVIVLVFRLKLPINFSYVVLVIRLNVIAILVIDLVSCYTFS